MHPSFHPSIPLSIYICIEIDFYIYINIYIYICIYCTRFIHTRPHNTHILRLALEDAPAVKLTGSQLESAKTTLKTGKAAIEKLLKDCKQLVAKCADKQDEVFQELSLSQHLVGAGAVWLLQSSKGLNGITKVAVTNDRPTHILAVSWSI